MSQTVGLMMDLPSELLIDIISRLDDEDQKSPTTQITRHLGSRLYGACAWCAGDFTLIARPELAGTVREVDTSFSDEPKDRDLQTLDVEDVKAADTVRSIVDYAKSLGIPDQDLWIDPLERNRADALVVPVLALLPNVQVLTIRSAYTGDWNETISDDASHLAWHLFRSAVTSNFPAHGFRNLREVRLRPSWDEITGCEPHMLAYLLGIPTIRISALFLGQDEPPIERPWPPPRTSELEILQLYESSITEDSLRLILLRSRALRVLHYQLVAQLRVRIDSSLGVRSALALHVDSLEHLTLARSEDSLRFQITGSLQFLKTLTELVIVAELLTGEDLWEDDDDSDHA